jgi:glycosyltransferase involved in cell wall biosynthesis
MAQLARIIRVSSRLLLGKQYSCNFLQAKSIAKSATRWLARQNFDVIIAPAGPLEVAFLETTIPIVSVEDSTCRLLFDSYPRYSSLQQRTIFELETLQQLALKKASAIIYSSSWAARSAIDDYGIDTGKVHVVPIGANLEAPSSEIAFTRRPSGHCRMLFLAVEWERKGGEIAFETLLALEAQGIEAELIICGCTPPEQFSHKSMRVIPFLDKNNESQRQELHNLLITSDFLLLPTRYDCLPGVLCEASAFGLPVVTTTAGGIPEAIKDGENGFLLPLEARGDAYAATIANLYRDDERYIQMAHASRSAFEQRLNWDVWGITVKQLLTDLLSHEHTTEASVLSMSKPGPGQ